MALPTNSRWDLEAETRDEEAWAFFNGNDVSLDESDTEDLEDQLSALLETLGRSRLVLDLGNVSYLTSSTLGVFLRLNRKLHAVGGGLVLVNALPYIYEVFRITNLDRLMEVRPAECRECEA
jgi:anti-sigma B factor antagonist